MTDTNLVELRGEIDADIMGVIDAVASAQRTNRMVVVRAILRRWAAEKAHEASLIQRVTARNGKRSEADRNQAELSI